MSVQRTVSVRNKNGLHARPSSVLAENALRFPDTAIAIQKGKSIMELLLLEASHGTELTLVASGPKAEEAIRALVDLFDREFDIKL